MKQDGRRVSLIILKLLFFLGSRKGRQRWGGPRYKAVRLRSSICCGEIRALELVRYVDSSKCNSAFERIQESRKLISRRFGRTKIVYKVNFTLVNGNPRDSRRQRYPLRFWRYVYFATSCRITGRVYVMCTTNIIFSMRRYK